MSGDLLALSALAALAVAGSVRRGSAAKWTGPRDAVKESLERLRTGLRLTDVRAGRSGTIYLLAPANRLQKLLAVHDLETGRLRWSGHWELESLLRSAGVHESTLKTYVENTTHWDGLYGVVNLFMQETGALPDPRDEYGAWTVRVVPKPGAPQEQTWSAKTGRVARAVKVEPFRFCEAGPVVRMGLPSTPALVQFGGRNPLPPMFLSHGVAFDSFRKIDKCKGFLWPSFALTWRQPTSYGDVVFLAPVGVLDRALTDKWKSPFYLAGTDIWSPTARDLGERQAKITEQLRGRSDRGMKNDLLLSSSSNPTWDNLVGHMSLGFGQDVGQTDRISKRRDLVRTLAAIMEDHVEGSDPYAYPPRPEWDAQGTHRYPYAELKVIGVVPVRNMVACFYPRQRRKRVHAFLDRQGFAGPRVPFGWSGPSKGDLSRGHAQHDALRREWAATVTRTILTWAEKQDATMNWPTRGQPDA